MSLDAIINDLKARIENVSGRPVLITDDASMRLLATAKIARGNAPAHLIIYNPSFPASLDYVISFQCGLIYRAVSAAKDRQFDFLKTFRGRKEAAQLVTERLRESGLTKLNKEQRNHLADKMYDGLILQLRSVPVGLRVDEWLLQEYPVLADQQRIGVERQFQEAVMSLLPEMKTMAPSKILNANLAMTAATAIFWAEKWHDQKILKPFTATGHMPAGERLLASFASVVADPDHDRDLIDVWGQALGLTGWYDFALVTG